MPPRHELNERFHGHIRRAQHVRAVGTTILATLTLIAVVGSAALAFQDIAPEPFARVTALAHNLPATAQSLGNLPASARAQLAAASSLPWLDAFADTLYRTVCPLLRDCPRQETSLEPKPQTTSRTTSATTTSSLPARAAAPAAVSQTIIQQPVIERIRETVRTVTEPGANTAYVDARIFALSQSLQSQIAAVSATQTRSGDSIVQLVGMMGRIDNLSGTTITNPTITGGTITAASITGTISNAISSALATITDLTATTIVATNATTSRLDAFDYVAVGRTATTTIRGDGFASTLPFASSTAISVSGIASTTALVISNAGGSGTRCLQVAADGTVSANASACGGSGASPGGSDTYVQFNDGSNFGGNAGFTFNKTTGRVAFSLASSSQQSIFDRLYVGGTATTTIRGDGIASTLPYASSTALTVSGTGYFGTASTTNLTVSSLASGALLKASTGGAVSAAVAGTDYVAGVTGDWTGTLDGYEASTLLASAFSTTSADAWKAQRNFFSTTSADYWETQQTARTADDLTNNSIEDLSDVAVMTENYGDLFAWNGSAWADFATSSLAISLSDTTGTLGATRGGTGLSSITAGGILLGNYAGTGWQQLATSTLGLLTTHVAEGSNQYYTDARVQSFVHASTTIPKTYSANTFTALQTFGNASTTNLSASYASSTQGFFGSLSIGSLTGFLKATAGSIATALINLASDVTGILPVANGGTGWSQIASGAVVLGNGTGAVATTSAGTNGQVLALVGGTPTWVATTTLATIGGTLSGTQLDGVFSSNGLLARTTTGTYASRTLAGTSNQITVTNGDGVSGNPTLSLPSLLTLTQASSTQHSIFDVLYVGRTATTTIRGDGVASSLPYASTTMITATIASTTALVISNTGGSGTRCLQVGADGTVSANASACGSGSSIGEAWSIGGNGFTGFLAPTTTQKLWLGQASSTLLSVMNTAYFGGSATTTFTASGNVLHPASGYINFGATEGTSGYGFRDNAGTLEFKNSGGSWQGVTTATSGPSFSVNRNGSATSTVVGAAIRIDWTNEVFDTNNNFDLSTDRFTPTVPGKYIFTATAFCSNGTDCGVYIYRNGIAAYQSYTLTGNGAVQTASGMLDMNGTTDYAEAYVYNGSNTGVGGAVHQTNFSGALIAPISSTAGGWQNDGTQSFLADNTDKVGVGTSTPWAKLSVHAEAGTPSFVIGSSTATYLLVNSSGSVGIGTTSPTDLLHVGSGTTAQGITIDGGNSGGNGAYIWGKAAGSNEWLVSSLRGWLGSGATGLGVGTVGATPFAVFTNSAERLRITSSGHVGIGVNPTYMLDVWSPSGTDARIGATTQSGVDNAQLLLTTNGQNTWTVTAKRSTNQFEITSAGGGGVYLSSGGTSWNSLSDQRLKTNISTLPDSSLDQILALNPVTYDWISAASPTTTQVGFIAQEVQAIFPQLISNSGTSVVVNGDGSTTTVGNTLGMNYTGLIPPMVKAIQELNLKLEDLATTTATSTDPSSFTSRFLASLFARLTQWFADTTNGIKSFFAERVQTKELCVDDVCVTREEFLRMKVGQSAAAGAPALGAVVDEAPADASASLGESTDSATTTTPSDNEPAAGSLDGESAEPAAVPASREDEDTDDTALITPGTEENPDPEELSPSPTDEPANDNDLAEELPAAGTDGPL